MAMTNYTWWIYEAQNIMCNQVATPLYKTCCIEQTIMCVIAKSGTMQQWLLIWMWQRMIMKHYRWKQILTPLASTLDALPIDSGAKEYKIRHE
jgi:hypothetical protein